MADQSSTDVRKSRTRSTTTKRKPRTAAAKKGVSVKGTDGEVTTIAANVPASKAKARARAKPQAPRAEKKAGPNGAAAAPPLSPWFDALSTWQKTVADSFAGQNAGMPDPSESLQAMQKAWSAPFQAFFGGQSAAMPNPTDSLQAMQKAWSAPFQAFLGGQSAAMPNPMENLQAMQKAWSAPFQAFLGGQSAAMPNPMENLQAMQKAWSAPFQALLGGETPAVTNPVEGIEAMQKAWSAPFQAMSEMWSKPGAGLNGGAAADAWEYWVDSAQRQILYWDTMRQRGNLFLEHKQKGKPPVLDFEYEMLMDGRTFERPVNYALVRIIPDEGVTILPEKRPYVIVDPRAGHGPGIGGFKKSSQIGVAMRDGHPAYFVTFFPDPEPGQTIFDVGRAEAMFLEEVARRHPKAKKPVVIGNCQAGWAIAMLSAVAPEVTGPIVLNGAPLSYWAGADGKNPMRYTGGLLGGSWLASLASDLGNGIFDGAWLVLNFENLNPANTLWAKQYNLYSKIDTEGPRFLGFERWWGGFFLMNKEEMDFIVENLFVGNKLQEGVIATTDRGPIDLRNVPGPIIVFASGGDNITPPQQALNWIARVYRSDTDIKIAGQTIVYILHEDIGHLGIFVSGKVAEKEHAKIVSALGDIEGLPPGLYEMVIEDKTAETAHGDLVDSEYYVRIEKRTIDDLLKLGVDSTAQDDFRSVAMISQINQRLYDRFVSPAVRAMSNDKTAEMLRWSNPKRMENLVLSDRNPWMWWLKPAAEQVRGRRQPVGADNFFLQMERQMSDQIVGWLNTYRDMRDTGSEMLFKALYGPTWLESLMFGDKKEAEQQERAMSPIERKLTEFAREQIRTMADKGSFVEGLVRIAMIMFEARGWIDERSMRMADQVLPHDTRFAGLSDDELDEIVKHQAYIVWVDHDLAVQTLPSLLPTAEDREAAARVFESVRMVSGELTEAEEKAAREICAVLDLSYEDAA